MLEFNQYQKLIKATFIIYADCEYLIEKFDGCKNNRESTSTAKVGEHSPSVFSMYTISLFKSIQNKHESRLHEKVLGIIKTARNEDN